MIKIAVCDDEKIFVDRISEIVKKFFVAKNMYCQVDAFESGKVFLQLEEKMGKYDIVFMDMQMDGMDGLQTAKCLRRYCGEAFLVFVTAFAKYAMDGYKVQANRYVIKDYEKMEADICEALTNAVQRINVDFKKVTYNFSKIGEREIYVKDITYVEYMNHRSIFHLISKGEKKEYYIYKKLDDIERDFSSETLMRIHQSYLVNVSQIYEIHKEEVILLDGTRLHYPKYRHKELWQRYLRRKGEF